MKKAPLSANRRNTRCAAIFHSVYFKVCLAGLLFPLGFSPYNYPGMTILSLAFFYAFLLRTHLKEAFICGFLYGLCLYGFGVSWVIISIHDYGSLNYFLSVLITFLFVAYLSLYPAVAGLAFRAINPANKPFIPSLSFAALWILSEVARSNLMTGFPWLLAGTSQTDSPLRYLAPLIGNYGVGFITCLAAAFLANSMRNIGKIRYVYMICFVLLLIAPEGLKYVEWTKTSNKPVSVAVIQANLSMRDKWDEALFWKLLEHYQSKTYGLMGNDLIVMPESAIPVPRNYIEDFLKPISQKAKSTKTAIILGILQHDDSHKKQYNNAIITLGQAKGHYAKQHLVPFGEYIPAAFKFINKLLLLPEPELLPGKIKQHLIKIGHIPIASLICYEIAYPSLLREQMPKAQWIVSVSDNGWFGHSLASYQQLQMARMLSLQTGRFQVVANNDGLSSVINPLGEIIASLPAFQSGVLTSQVYSVKGSTPWIKWGDFPVLILCFLIILLSILLKIK